MPAEFNWKRFWVPRGSRIDLSDSGYLCDPDSEWGKVLNPNAVSLDHLIDFPFLALLGEPGMGKTRALKREIEHAHLAAEKKEEKIISLDLRSFGSEERLVNVLFNSDEFKHWKQASTVLHLFLDSLDECLLRIDNVGSLIVDELAKLPTDRLRVRVACRTARWPSVLESGAKQLFGSNGFSAHELAPLRKTDVFLAAKESRLSSPETFMRRIAELTATPLAIRPVTLKFLVTTYSRNGALAKDQLQLYEAGCRILCEEVNESRLSAGQFGALTAEQRLAIAQRIAAVTQFSNRFAVWTGVRAEGLSDEDVTVDQLTGGSESPEVQVTAAAVREVLDSGLFSSRGPNRVGWAHQTYAEFLAARFVQKKGIAPAQVRSLLFHAGETPERLVPQLNEVASWMGALDESVFKEVAESDPEALLSAAAAGLSSDRKLKLIDALLAVCQNGRMLNARWELFRFYDKLKHPEITAQLKQYLVGDQITQACRELAVDIARACVVDDLVPTLADLALDRSQPTRIRTHSAAAVAGSKSLEQKTRLRALLAEDDPDDELKGLALRALWPDAMSAEELFSLISPPKRRNLTGAYKSFLYDLPKTIPQSALSVGLNWFVQQPHRDVIPGPIERLMDAIVEASWDNLGEERIADGLTNAIVNRLRIHDDLIGTSDRGEFYAKVTKNESNRHRILDGLVRQIDPGEAWEVVHAARGLALPADQPWLVERIVNDISPESKVVEAKLVWYLTDPRDPEAMRRLWHACQKDSILNAECRKIFGPMLLDAPEVKWLREDQRENAQRGPKPLEPPPEERIEADLLSSENGNSAAWLDLAARDLLLDHTGPELGYQFGPTDLSTTPGWLSASETVRQRILQSGLHYVAKADPRNAEWIATSNIPLVAAAGYQALELVLREKPELLDDIQAEAWKKWVPIILRYRFGSPPETDFQSILVQKSYYLMPAEFTRVLIQTIDTENATNGYLFVLQGLTHCWNGGIGIDLLDKVKDPSLKPAVLATLLCELLTHGVPGAKELAQSLISFPPPEDDAELSRMAKAAEALVACAEGACWTYIYPIFEQHPVFGRRVVEALSYAGGGFARFVDRLSESQLVDLYVWMVKQYPYRKDDGVSDRAGAMSASDTAAMLRDHLLDHLKKRASFAAVEGFRSIMQRLPELQWLRYHLEEAETLARANTWIPLTPAELIELTNDSQKRVVSNGNALLDAVVESLRRFESALHGELTPVRNLWNNPGGQWSPKDEEHLSDNIALHLDRDLRERGIVVNREVQIRRSRGKTVPGQSTDIRIDAISPGVTTADRISVIIEVKGNWNKDLKSAMEKQLRDRYLKDNQSKYGLYVIGWFTCPQWDTGDYRQRDCPSLALDQAKRMFANQASELSVDGYQLRAYVLDVRLSK